MESLLAIIKIINSALLAINAATGALQSVGAIVQPALDEGRQLTDDERAAVAALAQEQAEKTKATLQAIIDNA